VFDISFSELMLIAVVGLLVIGPEKLPKVARTLGAFTGRMQRFVAQVKEEVSRETRFEELQKLQQEVKDSVSQAESSIRSEVASVQSASSSVFNDTDVGDLDVPVKKTATRVRKPKASVAKVDELQLSPAKKPRAVRSRVKKSAVAESNAVVVDKTEVSD
jgi:sec-independent protein translocase protein TatB